MTDRETTGKKSSRPAPGSPGFARWLRRHLTAADLEALPRDDLAALRGFAVREEVERRAVLFRQGQAPAAVFFVERGRLALLDESGRGRLLVEIVRAGSSVGELAVLLERPYVHSAVAQTAATVLRLDVDTARGLVEIDPRVGLRLLRLVARRLDRAHRRAAELGGPSASEAIARFLVGELDEAGSPRIDITQQELADVLALSRQTVARVLRRLDEGGVVRRERGAIRIRDAELLRAELRR